MPQQTLVKRTQAARLTVCRRLVLLAVPVLLAGCGGDGLGPGNPAPVVTSISPTDLVQGMSGVVLTVRGSGFVDGSVVQVDGSTRATEFVSPEQLHASLASTDLSTVRTLQVTVSTPEPGGGTSGAAELAVRSPSDPRTSRMPFISLLPSRGASAGGSGFTLFVHGAQFEAGAVVRWNGADRPTQRIGAARLAASISAADVARAGTALVTVANPGEGDGIASAPMTMTVRTPGSATPTSTIVVPIVARDLAYDPRTGRIYLSVPGHAAMHPNSIVAMDPLTGEIEGSVFVGSEPWQLALSDDGSALYVGLDGASAVRRVDLPSFTPGLQWSLATGEVADDIAVAPGQPGTVAVSRHRRGSSPSLTGVTIYDDGVARGTSAPGHTGGSRIEFLESASVLYGYNNAHSGFDFFRMPVDESGVHHGGVAGGLVSGYYTNIFGAGGRIYGTDGSVVDAERGVKVGTLASQGVSVLADPVTGRAFVITEGSAIDVLDLNTFARLGSIPIPQPGFDHPALVAPRLVRWGADGLAFLDMDELILVRSPIVGK